MNRIHPCVRDEKQTTLGFFRLGSAVTSREQAVATRSSLHLSDVAATPHNLRSWISVPGKKVEWRTCGAQAPEKAPSGLHMRGRRSSVRSGQSDLVAAIVAIDDNK